VNVSLAPLIAAALAAGTLLSACGGSDSTGAEPGGTHTAANGDVYNDADVTFAQQMIPHHAQAVEMADMTRGRDLSPEVAQLAAGVMDAQTPEIETMTDWLTSWGEEVPETMRDHANAHEGDMEELPGDDMPGMLSRQDLEALESATGSEFEEMWLEMMVEHHQGAIEMAADEQGAGAFAPAIALAEDIEIGQTAEVEQMTELLDR
jgi:uncharacterized protein (DUF305 family)